MFRAVFVFCAVAVAVLAREPLSLDALRQGLAEHVAAERFALGTWGVKVLSLDSGAVLFETNAFKLLKPASNAKLYTAALALYTFGPEYRIRTSIYSERAPDANGTLNADLIIYGRGDPSFSARFADGSYSNLLGPIVAAIKRAGIRSIQGDLVGDETYFRGPRVGSGWTADDLTYYYGAEVSALTLQDNVIDLFLRPAGAGQPAILELKPETDFLRFTERPITSTNRTSVTVYRALGSREARLSGTISVTNQSYVDAVTVPNPALWFVTMLERDLAREGIVVRGKARALSWPDDPPTDTAALRELGYAESRPMRDLVEKMLKPSQNLYAQLLLLHVGAKDSEGLAERNGMRAMWSFLHRLGIPRREVMIEEGSGLSRAALITPQATTTLLKAMAQNQDFVDALPEPGEGTLRRRLLDLKGKLRAKTGSLRFVNTLSGYLTTEAGERLVFSIMLNAYEPGTSATSARDELDLMVRLLARLGEKTK